MGTLVGRREPGEIRGRRAKRLKFYPCVEPKSTTTDHSMTPLRPKKNGHRRSGIWLLLPLSITTYAFLRSSLHQIREQETNCTTTDLKRSTISDKQKIVWLTSFPNSGTSYTMTLIERSTNLSTATNYGTEVALDQENAVPVFPEHPEGPFWDGLSGKVGKIRYLPETYIMTKTHCGGRCVKCPATEYVSNATAFLQACEKTSGYFAGNRFESQMSSALVVKVIHLLRNPMTNVIARFHLEQRHLVQQVPDAATQYPRNAEGFRKWCHMLDTMFSEDDATYFTKKELKLMEQVPCHGEFYKYVQWHNLLLEVVAEKEWPVLTVFYEEYAFTLNETAYEIYDFLEQSPVDELRPFRDLPTYLDHFRPKQRDSIEALVKEVASPAAWLLLQRYFEDPVNSK